jgi:hypothetical protein
MVVLSPAERQAATKQHAAQIVHKSNQGVVSDKMQLALTLAQPGYGFSKLSHRTVRLG